MRERFANWLASWASALWRLSNRIEPEFTGPLCPDCKIGPDVGDNCQVCEDKQAQDCELQGLAEGAYDDGCRDGYDEARREFAGSP